jgi:hypothetical protein
MILSMVMGAMMAWTVLQIGDNMVLVKKQGAVRSVVMLQSWCCTQLDKKNY